MKRILSLIIALIAFGWLADNTIAQETSALDVMNEVHKNFYYAGDGGKAKVEMTLTDKKGRSRVREFWMLRTDIEDMGDQNYYAYFITPAEVRKTAVLTLKHADRSDDRWLYVPAVDLVKRIAATDNRASFVGSDFAYEDVSGRLPSLDTHEFLPAEELNGTAVTVIKSTPVDAGTADFAWRVTWIDNTLMLPLKEEYYDDKGVAVKLMTVEKIETIENIPTAVTRTMVDLKANHSSTITFTDVTYEVELTADKYRERLLKSPPASVR